MVKEAYVSFKIAKLLKEKGFSENTICKYADVGGITEKWYDDYRERILHFNWKEGYLIEPLIKSKDQYEIIGDIISAPTLQMVMKWLREVHKIHIELNWDKGNQLYSFQIWKPGKYQPEISSLDLWIIYKDDIPGEWKYEEACEEAIRYCLVNLI